MDLPVELETAAEGIIIPVQAQPRAKTNGITGVHAGRLKVAVTQAPEKGKANAAVIKVLAAALGLKKSQLRLVSGATTTQKKILAADITLKELQSKIAARVT